MDSFSLKDVVLIFIVPCMGYMCYAIYGMNATMKSLGTWIKTWPVQHEAIDNDRHDAVIRELNSIQARIK